MLNASTPEPFALERFFAQHEFSARYLLSSSDCDGFAMQDILAMASAEQQSAWDSLRLGYTESSGLPALRNAIANLYEKTDADDVFVLSPGEANYIFMHVMLRPGDHVICLSPAYQSLYAVPKSLGCELSYWHPVVVNGEWYFDPADLRKLIKKNTRLLITNFPHNPTGFIPDKEDFNEILKIADQSGVWIFSDEMYRELYRDPGMRLPEATSVYPRSVSLWGTAKTFGLAGLRIGWLVVRDKQVLEKIREFKDYLTICSAAPSEILSWIALDHSRELISINQQKINTNRALFAGFCTKNESRFTFYAPRAGSTAFAAFRSSVPTLNYCERLVQETGIMAVPGEMFGYDPGYLRIGLGRKNLGEALEVFQEYLNAQKSS